MSVKSGIPRAIDDFNPFIINTNDYLLAGVPTNAERLGISLTETDNWTGFLNDWMPLYLRYNDKLVGSSRVIKDQLLSVIERCVEMDRAFQFLDRIAASPGSVMMDLVTFNTRKKYSQKSNFSISISPISETLCALLELLDDGSVAVKCINRKNKASLVRNADSVQYVYRASDIAPSSADDPGLMKERSSKAAFTLKKGAGSTTKELFVYLRWYNTRFPERAGPWSELYSILLS